MKYTSVSPNLFIMTVDALLTMSTLKNNSKQQDHVIFFSSGS